MNEIVTVGKCKMCNNYSQMFTKNHTLSTHPPQVEIRCDVCDEQSYVYLDNTISIPNNIYVNALAFHKIDAYMNEQEDIYLNKAYNAEREGIVDISSKEVVHELRKARAIGLKIVLGLEDYV